MEALLAQIVDRLNQKHLEAKQLTSVDPSSYNIGTYDALTEAVELIEALEYQWGEMVSNNGVPRSSLSAYI